MSNMVDYYKKLIIDTIEEQLELRLAKLDVAGAVEIGAYTLPTEDGTEGQVLTTDGSGVVTWEDVS